MKWIIVLVAGFDKADALNPMCIWFIVVNSIQEPKEKKPEKKLYMRKMNQQATKFSDMQIN